MKVKNETSGSEKDIERGRNEEDKRTENNKKRRRKKEEVRVEEVINKTKEKEEKGRSGE